MENKKRIVDTYIDVNLPYPDAKVASVLCIGGAIKYELREGSGVSDDWVVANVCVGAATMFAEKVAVVLGRALMWAVFDDDVGAALLPTSIIESVKRKYAAVEGKRIENGTNPVKKSLLIVAGDEGNVIISTMVDENDENDGGNDAVRRRIGGGMVGNNSEIMNQVRILTSHVSALRQQNETLKNEVQLFKSSTNCILNNLNTSIRRLAMVPVARPRIRTTTVNTVVATTATTTDSIIENDENVAPAYENTLCKCPKTLYVLWQEYELGIGGRKPARLFNASERGKVKYNYSLRKVFWNLCDRLIRRGHTSSTAIDKIYTVYSSKNSVTQILRQMRIDNKNGGHPDLR